MDARPRTSVSDSQRCAVPCLRAHSEAATPSRRSLPGIQHASPWTLPCSGRCSPDGSNSAIGLHQTRGASPTLRQYGYFTRRLIELFALLAPFALLGLLPDMVWLTTPLALIIAGTFIVLAVTGAANDEPFANQVTDVPIDTNCTQLEHDVLTAIGHPDPPRPLQPVDGYLW